MKRGVSFAIVLMAAIALLPPVSGDLSVSADAKVDARPAPAGVGMWGGTHVEMELTEHGASLEFDCAQGTISEPVMLDKDGNFHARGTFHPQHGGPVRKDEVVRGIDVVYSGKIGGDTMELEFTIQDGAPEKFILVRGKSGRLTRCF